MCRPPLHGSSLGLYLGLCLTFVTIPLQAQNWVVSGTVQDSAGGAIQGVDFDLLDTPNGNVEIPVSGDNTDVNGSFTMAILTTLVPETYTLQINPPPGFLSIELEIDLSGDLDVGIINIGSGWIITGLVEDTLGNPLSPIDIDIRGNSGWLDLVGDFTEPDGTFSITIPALVDEYRFIYRMTTPQPTAFPLQLDNVFLFEDTNLGTIVLEPAHTLTGTVVDETGAPLPGIDMNIYDAQGTPTDLNNDDTDAAGNFSVLIPEGTWDVVHRQVNASATGERVPHAFVELNVLENLDLGTLTMPLGYHVTGLLVGSAGEVLVGANLDAEITETEIPIHLNNDSSNAAGEFDILLPAGNLNVEIDPPVAGPVRRPQLLPISVAAPGPLDLGTIVLPDAVLLSGRCIDTGGTPIPLIDVELLVSSTGEPYPTLHENGAPDGTFAVAIEIGTYHLLLLPSSSSGLAPVEIPQLEILSDTNLGDLVLNPGVSLSGTVLGMGTPQAQVTVSIQDPATGQAPSWGISTTDAQGNYAIALSPGIWDVFLAPPPGSIFPTHLEENLDISASLVFDIDLLKLTEPITDLVCNLAANNIELAWTNGATDYDSISILREGTLLTTIDGNLSEYIDSTPLGGIVANYELRATRAAIDSEGSQCAVQGPTTFIRCDAGPDGSVSIADAIVILEFLFASTTISCLDSADCNDSGSVNIADPVSLLQFLFGNGPTPPLPYPDSGADPTSDNLDCS